MLRPDPERARAGAARWRCATASTRSTSSSRASETHNRKNVNRSVEESLDGLERVLPRARGGGLRCEGVISRRFGCPYEGDVPRRARASRSPSGCADAGCEEVGFGDTTGMANPRQVRRVLRRARERARRGVELTAHFHNTRGQGLANVRRRAGGGRASFESSLRRARRLPRAARGDGQHRHRGPRLDAGRDGRRHRGRPRAPARGRARRPRRPRPPAGQPHARGRAGRLARPPAGAGPVAPPVAAPDGG